MKNLTLLISLFLVSCASSSLSKKTALISNGDSKQTVMNLMGPPENRQMKQEKEAWQYCETNFNQYQFLVIWLEDSKVSGISTYIKGGRPFSFCTSNFNSIRWEDAPDTTIEVRNR
ncbi:MAG: hypothetical protein CL674_14545 [Bdellovibrionaceae bacterium]|jgi:hypothetical protein|nr:hypothetical protein [Pseudobdellovibrionaceae bacterium]MAF92486.1 hypothetical protein [Pseudobdellovibrionaceae bacterium]|tara:strand:- start:27740 stop:28087 length:348 start_codon:yes stop_codon:yes gene_type:complete